MSSTVTNVTLTLVYLSRYRIIENIAGQWMNVINSKPAWLSWFYSVLVFSLKIYIYDSPSRSSEGTRSQGRLFIVNAIVMRRWLLAHVAFTPHLLFMSKPIIYQNRMADCKSYTVSPGHKWTVFFHWMCVGKTSTTSK